VPETNWRLIEEARQAAGLYAAAFEQKVKHPQDAAVRANFETAKAAFDACSLEYVVVLLQALEFEIHRR
jgi:hypothetical protein